MVENRRKKVIAQQINEMRNADLFILFIRALKTESYLYAGLLSDEIKRRPFSMLEIETIKRSHYYPMLNGIFDDHLART